MTQTVPLNVLRLKFIHHKLSRLLGIFAELGTVADIENKAVEIFTSFMQAMECHPAVLSTIGVALNHTSHNASQNSNRTTLSELDLANAEDTLLIAASLIVEIKVYEPTVLNPYNFSAICMLEHGLPYFPESLRIKQMLIKLYAKLGLVRTVTHYCKSVTPRPDKTIFTATKDFERLGAQRFSTVSGYGD